MIVKLLACDVEPAEVAARLRDKCLLDVSAEDVARFHPDAASPARPTGEQVRLAALFRATRAEYRVDEWEAAATETAFVEVASTSAFEKQPALCVEENGAAIALFKTADGFYAIDNTCTHRDGALCEGTLDGHEIECPLHGARFDVTTGKATALPAPDDVESYAVRVRGDAVEVELDVA